MPGVGSKACPKPVPGLYRHQKKQAKQKALADAYDVVNIRDGNRSRVSGCLLLETSVDKRQRREHHHLKGRRVRPDWREDPKRIILCSAWEHELLEADAILCEGDNANQRIVFFWNREKVKAGEEPFRIQSKRWSQNEGWV